MIIGILVLSLVLSGFVINTVGQIKKRKKLITVSRVLSLTSVVICGIGYFILR